MEMAVLGRASPILAPLDIPAVASVSICIREEKMVCIITQQQIRFADFYLTFDDIQKQPKYTALLSQ